MRNLSWLALLLWIGVVSLVHAEEILPGSLSACPMSRLNRQLHPPVASAISKLEPPDKGLPGMIWTPGGKFIMGNNNQYAEERYEHPVQISGFWMDAHEVTNAEFERFVQATGYVTYAEKKPEAQDFPGVSEKDLVAGSLVFIKPNHPVEELGWWQFVPGANWRHPEGPNSDLKDRANHPVVHVTYEDAKSYAQWANKDLPTEAQWEMAASGRQTKKMIFPWGNELMLGRKPMANTWQGDFPYKNTQEDGHIGTAPVGSYLPNDAGLYDLIGNVWELTQDWYQYPHRQNPAFNPPGPLKKDSLDPSEPALPKHVLKGGSFLCSPNYCYRYRATARSSLDIYTSASHVGFRCVKNIKSINSRESRIDRKMTSQESIHQSNTNIPNL